MKKDDHTLTRRQLECVRRHADLLLSQAGAYGRFPTPVDELVAAAKLEVERDLSLDESMLGRIYKSIREPARIAQFKIKRAISKVQGLLWRPERKILLDQSVHPKKQTFLSIHEIAHDFLPHQQKTYAILEDSESEIDPETKDLFEREANAFASEVLFQLDQFEKDAAQCAFGIKTPINLSRRFGASVYASARRYVQKSVKPCALLVFNQPLITHEGTTLEVRRPFQSAGFTERFGEIEWDTTYGPDSWFVRHLPQKQFGRHFALRVRDLNGDSVECLVEPFNSTYQVFYLIYPLDAVRSQVALVG